MEDMSSSEFSTARVDEGDKEIMVQESADTAVLPPWATVNTIEMMPIKPASVRSIEMPTTRRSSAATRSVRCINPAAYVEKSSKDGGSISSNSSCEIVPPLDLQSVCCSSPREDGYKFDYAHYGQPTKLKVSPRMAFENWLSAKRRIISEEAAKRKREEEARQLEKEKRKRLAEEKYRKWLEGKQQQERLRQQAVLKDGAQKSRAELKLSAEARKGKIEEWERSKRLQQENRRDMKRLEEEERKAEEEKRREMAQTAWNKWILDAPNKPKPVPLNRGLLTLRGTISDIFINPNEWKSNDDL